MVLGSLFTGFDFKNASYIFKRDKRNHASPNSAQTESAMSGALNIQLAGDAWYFGKLYKKPTIGDDNREIEAEDIRRANKLMYGTSVLGVLVLMIVIFCFSLIL